jgi:hypothetical protein
MRLCPACCLWHFVKPVCLIQASIGEPDIPASYLIEELHYDRDPGEVDVPLLRWNCAHLALAMSASGYDTNPTVVRWAEVVQDDPLPEVRHAEDPVSVRKRVERSQ